MPRTCPTVGTLQARVNVDFFEARGTSDGWFWEDGFASKCPPCVISQGRKARHNARSGVQRHFHDVSFVTSLLVQYGFEDIHPFFPTCPRNPLCGILVTAPWYHSRLPWWQGRSIGLETVDVSTKRS